MLRVIALLLFSAVLAPQTTEKAQEILLREFPGARITRKTLYLSKEKQHELSTETGGEVSRVQTYYLAEVNGQVAGFGSFDTHTVRTKQETLFIVMDRAGIIKTVEVAAFLEPPDYLAPARWLNLLKGRKYGDALELPPITGATLTVKSVKNAVRRTLALHRVHEANLRTAR